MVPGFPTAKPGDVLDVPNDIAQDLLAIRKAERVVDAPPRIEVREPEIDSRDPQPVEVKQPKRKQSKLA